MFRKNEQHLQWPSFSDLDVLPPKLKERLEVSWAGTFYREVFVRLDEEPFGVLYSDEASRPNIPINVLVGLETLKSGFGWGARFNNSVPIAMSQMVADSTLPVSRRPSQ